MVTNDDDDIDYDDDDDDDGEDDDDDEECDDDDDDDDGLPADRRGVCTKLLFSCGPPAPGPRQRPAAFCQLASLEQTSACRP